MRRLPILVSGSIAAAAALVWLLATGVSAVSALVAVCALALQTLAGVVVWGWIRGRKPDVGAVEYLGMGLALGSFIAMLTGVVLDRFLPGGWGWAAPSAVALVLIVVEFIRRKLDVQEVVMDEQGRLGLP